MINYIIGGTLLTFTGTNIINSIVLGTLNTIYSNMIFVKSGYEPNKIINNIKTEISKLDIKLKLDLINTLIEKIPTNDINKLIENGLHELISNIKQNIEWIDNEIIQHNTKWFSGYRDINIDYKLNELKNLTLILDGRLLLLLNMNKVV